jgi:hypothetical protein
LTATDTNADMYMALTRTVDKIQKAGGQAEEANHRPQTARAQNFCGRAKS